MTVNKFNTEYKAQVYDICLQAQHPRIRCTYLIGAVQVLTSVVTLDVSV